jgi:TPR repeat protein
LGLAETQDRISAQQDDSAEYARVLQDLVARIEGDDDSAREEMEDFYQNRDKLKWMKRAALRGDPVAQFALGRMYHVGPKDRKNYALARIWYEKAAAQGSAGAQTNLGYVYLKGRGVERNLEMACGWFRKGAQNGDINAKEEVAKHCGPGARGRTSH